MATKRICKYFILVWLFLGLLVMLVQAQMMPPAPLTPPQVMLPSMDQQPPESGGIGTMGSDALGLATQVLHDHGHPDMVAVSGTEARRMAAEGIWTIEWHVFCNKKGIPGLVRASILVKTGAKLGNKLEVLKVTTP